MKTQRYLLLTASEHHFDVVTLFVGFHLNLYFC